MYGNSDYDEQEAENDAIRARVQARQWQRLQAESDRVLKLEAALREIWKLAYESRKEGADLNGAIHAMYVVARTALSAKEPT